MWQLCATQGVREVARREAIVARIPLWRKLFYSILVPVVTLACAEVVMWKRGAGGCASRHYRVSARSSVELSTDRGLSFFDFTPRATFTGSAIEVYDGGILVSALPQSPELGIR